MGRPFTDYDHPLWPCRHCGCPQGEHAHYTGTNVPCTCRKCPGFDHHDEYQPTHWEEEHRDRL